MSNTRHDETTLTAKGAATRARIVEAASSLVYLNGAGNTRLDDIQSAAGVSASQLYHYFSDRRELMLEVIDHQTAGVLTAQRSALDELDSFEALERWRDMMVDIQNARNCEGGCPLGSLVSDLAETDPDARAALERSFDSWESVIRDGLLAMRRSGVLQADADVAGLALYLLTAAQGGLLLSQARRSTTPLSVALDGAIAHLRTFAVV